LIDPGVHLLDLLLCLSPGAACREVVATRGFWKTGIEEDVAALFSDGPLLATLRVSHIRWINTFRIELMGEDGYALVEGRGGTYGPMSLRLGKRWGWNDGSKRSQRETEEVTDFGSANQSLEDELRAVVDIWNGATPPSGQPHPATIDEALAVAALSDSMYRALDPK
jgi:predicted dehydrogenase